jgi:cellulose synthase/poly-beta-1,6-N-acetylglucosamine synthase-like glycosyltransferase/spore germination protein YaaH/peptidoglycan/xylan/chitin deacetylase (PgdA/CDA1 family)
MAKVTKQIFQTHNPTRWQRFKWGFRLMLLLLVLPVVAVTIAIRTAHIPPAPIMPGQEFRALPKTPQVQRYDTEAFGGFEKFIAEKPVAVVDTATFKSDSLGIRAAFFPAATPQTLQSLQKHVRKLNLILPDWFFLDPTGDSLIVNWDSTAFQCIKASGVKTMPTLTNTVNGIRLHDVLHRVLYDNAKQKKLILDLLHIVQKQGFAGICMDWQSTNNREKKRMIKFQRNLYHTFKTNKLLVAQTIRPFEKHRDYKNIARYNDYLFLQADSQHNAETEPGPISGQRWVQAVVSRTVRDVPPQKVVLCIGGFGFDWPLGGVGTKITYQQALSIAQKNKGNIIFDSSSYNLFFSYSDEKKQVRTVHFTDAATQFNTLRFATEYGLAGTALGGIGSEDSRIWSFYNRPTNKAFSRHFNMAAFDYVESLQAVDFMGEGEILDAVSSPTPGRINTVMDTTCMLITKQQYEILPSMYVIRKWGKTTEKKVALTFDNGPNPIYTPQILDILDKYHVVANFFVVGMEAQNNIPLVKRISFAGHELSNHTYSNPDISTVGTQRALLEMDATRLLLEAITGKSTTMLRPPIHTSPETMEELSFIALGRSRNYLTIGALNNPLDWQPNISADSIVARVIRDQNLGNILVLHDGGGNRSATVKALPSIIEYFLQNGYTFTTVADLMGKTRDEVMPPVPHYQDNYLLRFNSAVAETGYYGRKLFYGLLLLFLLLGTLRMGVILVFSFLERRLELRTTHLPFTTPPFVSIIVPAYNEEVNAVGSLHNLLRCNYPNFNIIFVNDGSKDRTLDSVRNVFTNHPRVTILDKPNGGKASALSHGIASTDADFVVCIDADTKLRPDGIGLLMQHFSDETVGAVAGKVKVGNDRNILTHWQSIEYTTSQNIDRMAFAYFNAITVVPGAVGAFRQKALQAAGGFTSDTLAEDCDITLRILRCGYKINHENSAVALTEVPETLKQFMKQRFRWTFGVMQSCWKNRDALLNTRYKNLGFVALPDLLLFRYTIPLFAPFADGLMIVGALTGSAQEMGWYYALFLLIDILLATVAFLFEKESLWKLIWIVPQRLVYRWLLLIVLFQTFGKALKGELQHWGVLKRTGNVHETA